MIKKILGGSKNDLILGSDEGCICECACGGTRNGLRMSHFEVNHATLTEIIY